MRRPVRLLFVVRDDEIISDSSLARCSEMLWWGGLGVVKRREMIAFRRKQGRRWLLPLLSWSSILSLQMIWLFCRTWWWVVMSDDDNKVVIWCWMRDDTDDCLVKVLWKSKRFWGESSMHLRRAFIWKNWLPNGAVWTTNALTLTKHRVVVRNNVDAIEMDLDTWRSDPRFQNLEKWS